MFRFSNDDGADFLLKMIFGIILLTSVWGAFSRVADLYEASFAMENGYEQVIDPETQKTLWKKTGT